MPPEVQTQVSAYMNNKRKPLEEKSRTLQEPKSIKVPIPTFPPTAMVYSVPKSPKTDKYSSEDEQQPQVDIVSAAIMAKVLEERQKERATAKHCDTCTCAKNLKIIYEVTHHHVGTQTGNEYKENVCLKCNELMTLPNTAVPQIIKNVEEKVKKVLPYPNLVPPLPGDLSSQNVVKVQPNNYCLAGSMSNPSLDSTNKEGGDHIVLNLEVAETKDFIDFVDVQDVSDRLVLEVEEKRDQEKR